MTDWVRGPMWVSDDARRCWGPRLETISKVWADVEIESVFGRVRDSALIYLAPEAFVKLSQRATMAGISLVPVAASGIPNGYAARHIRGGSSGLRCALTSHPERWIQAWSENDDDAIGEMLGFPACCRAFFAHTWGAGLLDPTWDQSTHGGSEGPVECNLLLRWIGVRLVPHLPCSYACADTERLGRAMAWMLPQDVRDWAQDLLQSPTTWTAVNGAGEVTIHGLLRFAASTDRAPEARAFTRRGSGTPPQIVVPEPTSWEDNGFSAREAMDAAHAPILEVLGPEPGRVLDLGCGDGALLAKSGSSEPVGVEVDCGRVSRGRVRHPQVTLLGGRIEDVDLGDGIDAVLLMPGRLLEMEPADAARVRSWLAQRARRVVVYGYGDNLKKYGGVVPLAQAAGYYSFGMVHGGPGVEAAEVLR